MSPSFSKDEEMEMWLFLRRKIKNSDDENVVKLDIEAKSEVWKEFKHLSMNTSKSAEDYENRFDSVLAPNLHKTSLSAKTKLELYYGLSIPVENTFLEYLRGTGELELDDNGCIQRYKESGEGGMEVGVKLLVPKTECVEEETEEATVDEQLEIWEFLYKKIRNPVTGNIEPLKTASNSALWQEFQKDQILAKHPKHYEMLYTLEMCSSLHSSQLDTKTKIELYYGLRIPVEQRFLRMLQRNRNSEVKVDKCRRITQYTDDDGLILGYTEPSKPRSHEPVEIVQIEECLPTIPFTAPEEMYMWLFLLQKVRDTVTGKPEKLKITPNIALWREFGESREKKREAGEYFSWYENHMCHSLHTASLVKQIKLELYYGLDLRVNEQFLKEIENPFSSVTIKKGRLVEYEEVKNDGKIFSLGPPNRTEIVDETPIVYLSDSEPPSKPARVRRCKNSAKKCSDDEEDLDEYLPRKKQQPKKKRVYKKGKRSSTEETLTSEEPQFSPPSDQPETSAAYYERQEEEYYVLSPKRNRKKKTFSTEEEREMWIFLLSKIRHPKTGKAQKASVTLSLALWEEFRRINEKTRDATEYWIRFDLVMAPAIHLTQFVRQTKLEFYYGLNVKMDEGFLEECKSDSKIIVDEEGRLVAFEDNREGREKFTLGNMKAAEENRTKEKVEEKEDPDDPVTGSKKKVARARAKRAGFVVAESSFSDWDLIRDESSPNREESEGAPPPKRVSIELEDISINRRSMSTRRPVSDDEGPSVEASVFLGRLKEAIGVLGLPELDNLQREIDEKMKNCEDGGKSLTLNFMRRLVESSFVAASM
uniref:SPK domain-containing protein n=1 Tax=Caenorhabditis tropicalis TaxID=1561998 RepID=A0A1I7T2P2_9PELO